MMINNFKNSLVKCFRKLEINKNKNIYITSNLSGIAKIRIRKHEKVKAIFNSLTKTIGKNYTIFAPSASLNLCNTKIIFDPKHTPSFNMGPLAEFIRNNKKSKKFTSFLVYLWSWKKMLKF